MPEFRKNQPIGVLALIILLMAGCATLGAGLEPPRVSLASMRVKDIRGFETAFEVDLRILNRSNRTLVIEGLDCQLMLGGRQLAEGVANPRIEIPPYDSGVVSVMVYSSMLDMVGVARRIIRGVDEGASNEPISYEISGHLVAGSTSGVGKFPFTSNGEIDLGELTGDR